MYKGIYNTPKKRLTCGGWVEYLPYTLSISCEIQRKILDKNIV